jgi:hypothetical protein
MFRPKADHLQVSKLHKHKITIAGLFYGETKNSVVFVSHVAIISSI